MRLVKWVEKAIIEWCIGYDLKDHFLGKIKHRYGKLRAETAIQLQEKNEI